MVVRVADPDKPAFQLRRGEEGISVFDLQAVKPALTETEILESFRPGSQAIVRSVAEIERKGLQVVPIPGAEPLPERLRQAHAEIRPGPGITRGQFKQILKELE
jgi:2-iminoacetate synthase ThiH